MPITHRGSEPKAHQGAEEHPRDFVISAFCSGEYEVYGCDVEGFLVRSASGTPTDLHPGWFLLFPVAFHTETYRAWGADP